MQASDDLDLGSRWEVLELYLKPYPAAAGRSPGSTRRCGCGPTGLDPARIAAIEVRTFAAAEDLSWRRPRTTEEMQYSLAWPVATALARGRFGVDEVLTGFDDSAAARLVERMRLVGRPRADGALPGPAPDGARGRARRRRRAAQRRGRGGRRAGRRRLGGRRRATRCARSSTPARRCRSPSTWRRRRAWWRAARATGWSTCWPSGCPSDGGGAPHDADPRARPAAAARGHPGAGAGVPRARGRQRRGERLPGRELRRPAAPRARGADRGRGRRRRGTVVGGALHAVLRGAGGAGVRRLLDRAAPAGALARAGRAVPPRDAGAARALPAADRARAASCWPPSAARPARPARCPGVYAVRARARRRRLAADLHEALRVARALGRLAARVGRRPRAPSRTPTARSPCWCRATRRR